MISIKTCGRPGPSHGRMIVADKPLGATPRNAPFVRYIRVANIVHCAVTVNKDL